MGQCIPFVRGKAVFQRGRSVYPFAKMGIGDFFEAPRTASRTSDHQDIVQMRVARAANMWAKRNHPDRKFSTTIVSPQFVRCQRVA